jgi:hypothetical protein
MNKILYIALLYSIVNVVSACSKDSTLNHLSSINSGAGTTPPDASYPAVYNLTASNWVTSPGSGVYTSDIGAVPSLGKTSVIKIYVVDGIKKTQINNSTNFANGVIWAVNDATYIRIVYRDTSGSNAIPFSSLKIRIEIW